MKRALLVRLAQIVGFAILLAVPSELRAQSMRKSFKTPEGAPKVSAMLAWGSEYIPDAIYEEWWREIAACEELPLPTIHYYVRFYQVNAVHFYDELHPSLGHNDKGELVIRWALAISYPKDLEIYVALPYRAIEQIIKHEMLHFLIYWAGIKLDFTLEDPYHPPDRFERCGITTIYNEGPPSS